MEELREGIAMAKSTGGGMKEFQEFVKSRDEALLSMDADKIGAFAKKYRIPFPDKSEPIFVVSVHKMRSGIQALPPEEIKKLIKWLSERGFSDWSDDDLEVGEMHIDSCKSWGNPVDTQAYPEAYIRTVADDVGDPDLICLCRDCAWRK